MLQTSPNGLETNYWIIGTFIGNSQVLPLGGGGLFINNYSVDGEGEPVASKYLFAEGLCGKKSIICCVDQPNRTGSGSWKTALFEQL